MSDQGVEEDHPMMDDIGEHHDHDHVVVDDVHGHHHEMNAATTPGGDDFLEMEPSKEEKAQVRNVLRFT